MERKPVGDWTSYSGLSAGLPDCFPHQQACCASAGGSSAKGARVPLEDETAFGWEEQGEEEGEEEGEAPARVELD